MIPSPIIIYYHRQDKEMHSNWALLYTIMACVYLTTTTKTREENYVDKQTTFKRRSRNWKCTCKDFGQRLNKQRTNTMMIYYSYTVSKPRIVYSYTGGSPIVLTGIFYFSYILIIRFFFGGGEIILNTVIEIWILDKD